jgi:hypothetical protein
MLNRMIRSVLAVSACISGIFLAAATIAFAHHAQDMQGMKDMPVMKSEEPVVVLKMDPANIRTGIAETMTVSFKYSDGQPVHELSPTHERILHVIIASQDFTVFSHIHPEDFGLITTEMKTEAQYPVRYTLPKSGRYIVGLDFAVKDRAYSKHFVIDVAGGPDMEAQGKDFSRQKMFGAYNVSLTTAPETISAAKETTLIYRFWKDGAPVTDLEPYIAAVMHVAVISTDLNQFIHGHGLVPGMSAMGMNEHHMMQAMSLPSAFGPEIKVPVTFPAAGVYEIFGEVKHKGKVIVTHFMVEVK